MGSKFWSLSHLIVYPIFHNLLGVQVNNTENLLMQKSAVVAANHQSNWDPPVVGFSIYPRQPYFIAKTDLFKIHPAYSWLIRTYHAIEINPAKRDLIAIKTGLSRLEQNYWLIIFPEGTRKRKDQLKDIKAGAAFFSIKANVPLIPCYIHYATLCFRKLISGKSHIEVTFGRPIYPPTQSLTLSRKAEVMANHWKSQMEELCQLK
jgi:1-acyl-sn-glycerol-3-phosphate acyltransferase